jgi:hypothetical protein
MGNGFGGSFSVEKICVWWRSTLLLFCLGF